MKKVLFYSTLCLVTLSLFMTGCKKDEPKEPAKVQKYHISIQAGKTNAQDNNDRNVRKALGLDGNTLNASWAEGEKVTVRNLTKNANLTGYLEAQSDGVLTTLEGDVDGTINAGDALELSFLTGDYANQEGTLDYIASHCDYAKDTIHVTSVTWGDIQFEEEKASFNNKQAIVKFILKNETKTETLSASSLVVEVNSATYSVTPASATSEIFVAIPGFSGQTIKLTATVSGENYTFTSSADKTLNDGKYYIITVGLAKKVATFSIDPTHKIEFAHGNLQYNHSAPEGHKWRIAREQYDFVGDIYRCFMVSGSFFRLYFEDNGTVYENDVKSNNLNWDTDMPNVDCWIDYFCWNSTNFPLKVIRDAYEYAYTQADFVDWGSKPIDDPRSGETYPANTWRTPTATEWDYIFCERPNAGQLFGLATLTGHPKADRIQGVIIFPDDFEVPTGFRSASDPSLYNFIHNTGNSYYSLIEGDKWPNKNLNNPGSGVLHPEYADTILNITTNEKFLFNQNIFTIEQWKDMESKGAVFLPALGERFTNETSQGQVYARIYDSGISAWYWSSTHQGAEYRSAYAFETTYSEKGPTIHPHGATRSLIHGLPVRLVRDVE